MHAADDAERYHTRQHTPPRRSSAKHEYRSSTLLSFEREARVSVEPADGGALPVDGAVCDVVAS